MPVPVSPRISISAAIFSASYRPTSSRSRSTFTLSSRKAMWDPSAPSSEARTPKMRNARRVSPPPEANVSRK